MMETIKLSRRDFTRAVVSAGAFYFGLPHVPGISDLDEAVSDYPVSDHMGKDSLVILAKGDELIGFRGFEEFTMKDPEMVEGLSSSFENKPGEYRKEDPLVIFVNEDEPVAYRGFEELTFRDHELVAGLSSRFGSFESKLDEAS